MANEDAKVMPAPYPMLSKQAAGMVSGSSINAASFCFGDKIMVTLTQAGRLSQWVQVPLLVDAPSSYDVTVGNQDEDGLLPPAHLTPMTLLGVRGSEREITAHLVATQIAGMLQTKDPQEQRTLIVGLGLADAHLNRESYFDILELLQQVI